MNDPELSRGGETTRVDELSHLRFADQTRESGGNRAQSHLGR